MIPAPDESPRTAGGKGTLVPSAAEATGLLGGRYIWALRVRLDGESERRGWSMVAGPRQTFDAVLFLELLRS